MKTDVIYLGILILIMILVLVGDIKLVESIGKIKKTVTHHVKRTAHIVRKTMTKRQKPENKKDGTSIDNTKYDASGGSQPVGVIIVKTVKK
jgi:Sec-independent protein translocase protein TatA